MPNQITQALEALKIGHEALLAMNMPMGVHHAEARIAALPVMKAAIAALSSAAPSAAEPVAVPEGWKLVPVEPTQEMCDACTRVLESEDVPGAWAEMLAAAPPAPQAESESVAGLSGDAEREAIERAATMLGHRLGYIASGSGHRAALSALHSTGKPQAIPSPAVVDGWQPIETAPMDGTAFWGYREAGGKQGVAYRVPRDDCEMWSFCGSSAAVEFAPYIKPTHWMPLPAPPESKPPVQNTQCAATADAPVAEPVFYVHEHDLDRLGTVSDYGGISFKKVRSDAFSVPLYTRPPAPEEGKDAARKLLSREEIRLLAELRGRRQRRTDAEVHDLAEKAGFSWIEPDGEEGGFPGGFDMSDFANMRSIVDALTIQCTWCKGDGATEEGDEEIGSVLERCDRCSGTGVAHEDPIYRLSCADGRRCLHGCHHSDKCAHGITDAALSQGGGA